MISCYLELAFGHGYTFNYCLSFLMAVNYCMFSISGQGGGPANGTDTDTDKEVAVARTYLLRMKTEEETTKLSAAIKEHAPAA